MKNIEFLKKFNIPIVEINVSKTEKGKIFKFYTKNNGKEWGLENRLSKYSDRNDLGINFQFIKNNNFLIEGKYKLFCIDIDIKENFPNKERELVFQNIKFTFDSKNYCYEVSSSEKGFHLFFILEKDFVSRLSRGKIYLRSHYKSENSSNGVDLYFKQGFVYINNTPNWNLLIKKGSQLIITPLDELESIIKFIFEVMHINKLDLTKNTYIDQNKAINKKNGFSNIPKIYKLSLNKYSNKNENLKEFLSGNIEKGTRHNFIFNNYIPHIYFIFGEYNKFLSKCYELGYEEQADQFKNHPKNPTFIEVCNSLKRDLKYKKEPNLFLSVTKSFEELQNNFRLELGSIHGLKNWKEVCIINDNHHIQYVDYEWVRNQILTKLKKEEFTPDELRNFKSVFNKIIESEVTNSNIELDKNKYFNGILFNNGYFDLQNLKFSKKKQDALISFNIDFNKNDFSFENYPNYFKFIQHLSKITNSELIANTIMANILDFNSDKRFMIVIDSKQGKGKTWFINFLNRLFHKYSSPITYNFLLDGKEVHKSAENILLFDNDISKRIISEPDNIKKIITGDILTAKKLYIDPIGIRSIATIILGSNHPIRFSNSLTTSDGINRRTFNFTWKNTLFSSADTPDYYVKNIPLSTDLRTEFISAILQYLISQKTKSKIPTEIKDYQKMVEKVPINKISKIIRESGSLNEFIEYFEDKNIDNKHLVDVSHTDFKVLKTEFYKQYVEWCKSEGTKPLGKQSFNQKLLDDFDILENNQANIKINNKEMKRQRIWIINKEESQKENEVDKI